MSKTLKQILDQVFGETGFELLDAYANSPDINGLQSFYLANRSARSLRDFYLSRSGRNIGVTSIGLSTDAVRGTGDGGGTRYNLPSDFYAYVPDSAVLDGTAIRVDIPTSPDTWSYVKSLGGNLGGVIYMRFINDYVEILNPGMGRELVFEYIRNGAVRDSATNAYKVEFEKDTDIWDRDDDLIILDLRWRFKREKGLDWEGDLQIFNKYASALRMRDGGAETIGPPRYYSPMEPYTNLWVQH